MAAPTERESDGLAVSPANARLSPQEREAAPALFRALLAGQLLHALGERKARTILAAARRALEMEPRLRVDALDLVDAKTLLPVKRIRGPALLAGAITIGETRLTDRVRLE
jgi:pantoate--beta-alanine ligase